MKNSIAQNMKIRRIFMYTLRITTKNWFAFNENILKLLAKSASKPLGSTTAAAATDAAIHKKIIGSGIAILIIWK